MKINAFFLSAAPLGHCPKSKYLMYTTPSEKFLDLAVTNGVIYGGTVRR